MRNASLHTNTYSRLTLTSCLLHFDTNISARLAIVKNYDRLHVYIPMQQYASSNNTIHMQLKWHRWKANTAWLCVGMHTAQSLHQHRSARAYLISYSVWKFPVFRRQSACISNASMGLHAMHNKNLIFSFFFSFFSNDFRFLLSHTISRRHGITPQRQIFYKRRVWNDVLYLGEYFWIYGVHLDVEHLMGIFGLLELRHFKHSGNTHCD